MGMDHRNVLFVGHALFECLAYDSQKLNCYKYLRCAIIADAYSDFPCASASDKCVFWLSKKQGLLVSDDCRT